MRFNRPWIKIQGPTNVALLEKLAVQIDLNPQDLAKAAKRSDEMGLAELKSLYSKRWSGKGTALSAIGWIIKARLPAPFVCIFLSVLGTADRLAGKIT